MRGICGGAAEKWGDCMCSESWTPTGNQPGKQKGIHYKGHIKLCINYWDRLCGLVVRVSGYRYRGPGFDPRRYQFFWVVMGLEWGPLSLVRSSEELLEWKSSGSRSRKQRLTAVGTRCADHVTPLYPHKLALTSPTGCGRSVGIVRMRTKATELVWFGYQEEPTAFVTCKHWT